MGIYVFDFSNFFDELRRDANDRNSSHDFGKDVIPYRRAVAHQFSTSCAQVHDDHGAYWRGEPAGTANWAANNLPNMSESIFTTCMADWTHAEITAPAKFVHDEEERRGTGGDFACLRRMHHIWCCIAPLRFSPGCTSLTQPWKMPSSCLT